MTAPDEYRLLARVFGTNRFFATVPAGGRLETIRLVRTAANGHLALAAYLPDKSARCHGYGIMVFTITREGIATITGFPGPDLFGRFGLPLTASDGSGDPVPGPCKATGGSRVNASAACRPCSFPAWTLMIHSSM